MDIKSGYTIEKLTEITCGTVINDFNNYKVIEHLLTDSRQLVFPAKTVFFALKSPKNDGHKYIMDLINKGVGCFVVSHMPSFALNMKDVAFIIVDNTLESLQKIAAYHREQFNLPLIAITGSNGKTIIKEWLSQLITPEYKVIRNPKSYNSQIGVPLSVWQINNSHEMGIFEAGISKTNEMQNLQKILKPNIGIFTNIGPAHDEGFKNRKEKIREKLKLFEKVETLIYCSDHKDIASEITQWVKDHPSIKTYSWSKNKNNQIHLVKIINNNGSLNLVIKAGNKNLNVNLPFTDNASLENAMHCITAMIYLGYNSDIIKKRLFKLEPVAMRMELKHGINNTILINDSYNSDFNSLKVALDFLSTYNQHSKKALILSDILQTGIVAETLYKEVAKLIKEKSIDHIIGIGPEISSQANQFDILKTFYRDTDEFLKDQDFIYLRDHSILIKGARTFGFERIVNELQLKDHQTVLEININNLIHNLNIFKSILNPGVKIMVMVKAFGYGIGSSEISGALQYHNVDYLAVAYTDEGKELRNAGITTPIMVMNPEISGFESLIKYNLEPEVYNFKLLKKISEGAKYHPSINSNNPLNIHLKIDSGMHRLGFSPDYDIKELINFLKKNPLLKIRSVFSHFAASDDPQFDTFSNHQLNLFNFACYNLENELGYKFLKHICNTEAISRFKNAHMDMVRLGIGLYGISSNPKTQNLLKNICTFKSVISQIKTLPKGEMVGYNPIDETIQNTKIGIVPVGYADGLNRKLGKGKGRMLVKDVFVPTIGNICMDMCMIDLTGIDVNEGDEVIIFGEKYPVSEVAKDLDTIPYEVLSNISSRVKRIYYHD